MDLSHREYRDMRDIWNDYNHRQEFEHDLINRKTTWLLTTQALLFAAYGITFGSTRPEHELLAFHRTLVVSGMSIAAVVFVGVIGLVISKRLSWKAYRVFFDGSEPLPLPRPLEGRPLEWGVRTRHTWVTLLPDVVLPVVFILAWGSLAR